MKLNGFYSYLTLIILVTSSCTKNNLVENSTIDGDWHLVKYEHSTNGKNVNFIRNDIVWNFNENSNKLIVEINISATTLENYESIYIGLDSGIYEYSIIEKNGISYLMIDNNKFGNILISPNKLIINKKEGSYGAENNLSTWSFEH